MANFANQAQEINYISQRKKICVGRNNQPVEQLIHFDYRITDTFSFSVVNAINQIVNIGGKSYEIYGSFIDAKNELHVIFYTNNYSIQDNVLTFVVDTYTNQYLEQIKNDKEIDLTIVAHKGEGSQVVLRDRALASPRPYVEGREPLLIVYTKMLDSTIPISGQFGAGTDIDLVVGSPSFAFGEGLITNDTNQIVFGQYNAEDATKVLIVGGGTESQRANIFSISDDGNVDVAGALSTTALYINGQEVNLDIDSQLSATSAWVSGTFETAQDATGKFETLTGQINDLTTGQVAENTSGISALNNAISAKADKTDLEALSGTVEGLAETKADLSAIPTGNAQLQNTANYITSTEIPTSYVQKDDLADYAKTSAVPTKTSDLTNDSGYITLEDVPSGTVYGAGFGLATSGEANNIFYLTGTVLSAGENLKIENNIISLTGDIGGTYTPGTGISIEDNVISVSGDYASNSDLTAVSSIVSAILEAEVVTPQELSVVSSVITAQIPTSTSSLTNDSGFITLNDVPVYTGTSGIGVDENHVIAITGEVGKTYTPGSGIAISNTNEISVTGMVAQDEISDMATKTWVGQQNYISSVTLSAFSANTQKIEATPINIINLASSDFVTWNNGEIYVNENKFAQASDIPTDSKISGIATNVLTASSGTIVTAATGAIPTDLSAFSNAHTNFLSSITVIDDSESYVENVTGLVFYPGLSLGEENGKAVVSWDGVNVFGNGAADVRTTSFGFEYNDFILTEDNNDQSVTIAINSALLTGKADLSAVPTSANISGIVSNVLASSGVALTSDIPTSTSSLTNDSGFITGITVTYSDDYDTYTLSGKGLSLENGWFTAWENNDNISIEWQGVKIYGGSQSIDQKSTQLDWSSDFRVEDDEGAAYISLATPIPSAVTDLSDAANYALTSTLSTVSGALNTAITNVSGAIPTGVSQLVNDTGFITSNDINLVGGAGIRVMKVGNDTVISIATATISAVPSAYTFDFRNTSGTADFNYASANITQSLMMNYTGTLPVGVTATPITSGYQFEYVSGTNVSNTTSTITAYFDAVDIAHAVSAEVQITTIGFVNAAISTSPITSYVFDANNAQSINTFTWDITSGTPQNMTVEISGTLPLGVTSAVSIANRTLTLSSTSDSLQKNITGSINVIFDGDNITKQIVELELKVQNVLIRNPLIFKGTSSTNAVQLSGTGSQLISISLSYSKNDGAWQPYNVGDIITLNENETVAFSGANTNGFNKAGSYYNFKLTGTCEASGNIMSLLNYAEEFTNIPNSSQIFAKLFQGCTGLLTAPELPATVIPDYAYNYMFDGCNNLTAVPELPGLTFGLRSYEYMFQGCSKITDAKIAITTLDNNWNGFANMFRSCSLLSSIEVNFSAWGPSTGTAMNWVQYVASNGTFICPTALGTNETITRGVNNCPQNWTVVNK